MITKALTARRAHVWSQDPALDDQLPGHDWGKFLLTSELSHLGIREGERPTVFQLQPLTRAQMIRVMNLEGMDRINAAVAYGLRAVDGFSCDGQPVELEMRGKGDDERVSERSLDRIFDPLLFAELGTRIIDISQIHPLSSRG